MKNMKKILLVFVIALATIGLASCGKDAVMHTVTFANTDLATVQVADGQKVAVPSAPTLAGQEFDDWYVDAAFSARFDFDKAITKDTTIYAKFNILTSEVTHTVVFANTNRVSAKVVDGQKLAVPVPPSKDGHDFDGWYKEASFTTLFDFNVAITADVTIYAKFSASAAAMYTVIFANTDLASIEIATGEKLARPEAPVKEGYLFDDWYKDATFSAPFDFDQAVVGNTTLYARFSLTFDAASAIASQLGDGFQTVEKYYLAGTIKSINNVQFGNMVITYGGQDFVIYGVFSADGSKLYGELTEKPVVGDHILIYGVLSRFKESLEMKNSWLMKMEKGEIPPFDLAEYTNATIDSARSQAVDSKVVVEGVVARITLANGLSPNGLFLVDATGAIYVYDSNIAVSVKPGDTIKVAGVRKNFILEDEVIQAGKLGYDGAIQLAEAVLVAKTDGTASFNKDWIETKTVKELLETDARVENITGNIYKVNAFINEVPDLGFTNFYINDLDGTTGSYSYSMNNGNDFTWLRQYDGQLKTIYVAVINAKSTPGGLIYRFVPIEVEGDFVYDQAYNPTFAVKYYGVDQFLPEYYFSPDRELQTTVSSAKLGVTNVALTYHSNNVNSVYFEVVGDKVIFKTGTPGVATVTVTGTDGANTYEETVMITVWEEPNAGDVKTVAQAIALPDNTVVILEGIVGASLVNKVGFYLIDETGVVAVEMVASELAKVNLGQLVIITGNKTHTGVTYDTDSTTLLAIGQLAVREATILANKYGSHEYSTASFKTGKVLADFIGLNRLEEHSTDVYTFDATVLFVKSGYSAVYSLNTGIGSEDPKSINIYASSAAQVKFLEQFIGKEVTAEFTVVNWNGKNYVGSVLSVTYQGVKVVNNSNFQGR